MKEIILSTLALISCLSLGSCSNEEKPLKTIQLKENQTLKIDKYEFSFDYINCYYRDLADVVNIEHGLTDSDFIWRDAKLQSLPFAYTSIILKVYSNSLAISVDFNNEALNKLYEDSKKIINVDSPLFNGEFASLYTSKNLNQDRIAYGILIDSKTSSFIYSPESFDYSDYSLTFNANTTPYELKEVSK